MSFYEIFLFYGEREGRRRETERQRERRKRVRSKECIRKSERKRINYVHFAIKGQPSSGITESGW